MELIKLRDSDLPRDATAKALLDGDVYDRDGEKIGTVKDLYIDTEDEDVRFLEVGAGGFLGIGEKHFLVPVEAVTEVAEEWVAIEPGRTEKVEGPAPFDTKVAPPPAEDRRAEDYAWLPYGKAEGPAEHRGGYPSSFPDD